MTDIIHSIAAVLSLKPTQVESTLQLLDEGATIPFISRYRKERTGGLNEVQVFGIQNAAVQLREIEQRRQFIENAIAQANALTPELKEKLSRANASELEDLYLPFKPKRRTRATSARELGLEPLAKIIMSGKASNLNTAAQRFITDGVADANAALVGAADIIAEWVNEHQRTRNFVRSQLRRTADLHSVPAKDKEQKAENYRNYFNYSSRLGRIPSHAFLAIRRAEQEGLLKVSINAPDNEIVDRILPNFIKDHFSQQSSEIISEAVKDAYKRLTRPSIINELLSEAKERADNEAIQLFADNARQLLLAPPLHGKSILAIDPGYRTGCKIVCLNPQGELLHHDVIYPTKPHSDILGTTRTLQSLIKKYNIQAIALGSGTASRDTENVLRSIVFPHPVEIYIVNENGASVYSASELARAEFPNHDLTVRGAVSIGRRLIDPLAELVKIDPKSIGVGQYQHDVNQTSLHNALDFTVTSCVNSVGVNVNTASPQLLAYVAGIGPQLASNIVAHRSSNGKFKSKAELLNVNRLGAKAFDQAAGFLRITDGLSKLDNTGIHPESYHLVQRMARDLGVDVETLIDSPELIKSIKPDNYYSQDVGEATISLILNELLKPGHDPRSDNDTANFDPSINELEDIKVGMVLEGVVNNITAFGAFVDVGIHENGLIHISQLSTCRVSTPAEVVKISQIVKVKVIEVDLQRRRLALSLKDV